MKKLRFKPVASIMFAVMLVIMVAKVSVYHSLTSSNHLDADVAASSNSAHIDTSAESDEPIFDDILSEEEVDDMRISQREASSHPNVELTDDELYTLASVVYLEAGGESYKCQKAVASVIINRMCHKQWSLDEVLNEPNQFSTMDNLDDVEPSESCIRAAKYVSTLGHTVPWYVMYFRADCYHDFGDLVDYIQIDNTYFSYSQADKDLVGIL